MKRFLLCFSIYLSMICVLMSVQAHGAVVERDWKVPGDGLLTFDTVNKREWLDLSQTILDDRFPGTGADFLEIRESRYQYVVGQTAPGGLFEGFTVAKSADVTALAESAGIDTSSQNYALNSVPTLALGELLGFTIQTAAGNKFSTGLLDELTESNPLPFRLGAILQLSFTSQAGLIFRDPVLYLQSTRPSGAMLYRAVPEPAPIGLTIYLLLLCNSRKWRSMQSNS